MKFIKGLLLALTINVLITLPALLMAVAIGHGFWGLWAGCGVALILSMVDEKSKEALRGFSYAGLVLAVLLASATNAGVGWFFAWSPWLVVVCPAINMAAFFLSAMQERPTRRPSASGLTSTTSSTIDPSTVLFWGSDTGSHHHHHHHHDDTSHCHDSGDGGDGGGSCDD